jgi:PKD repeat protein/subtilisin family serine protease
MPSRRPFQAFLGNEFTTVLNGLALRADAGALDWAWGLDDVAIIEPDYPVKVSLSQSVPIINGDDMWKRINATGVNITGKGVIVAVLDTGVDYAHKDLGGTENRVSDFSKITSGTHPRIVGGWNIITNTSDFWDGHFHGTHCAGIVGANGTLTGVAPECKFRIYKVLADSGSGPSSGVIRGIELATDPNDDGDTSDHSDVLSLSLGGFGHPDDAKAKAVDNSMTAGAVVAVAAGNYGTRYETLISPGCARKVISVGGTDKSDKQYTRSSTGPSAVYQIKPDVLAPGVSIYSCNNNHGYRYATGTSMATPHVAGSAALLIQSHPKWTTQQVKQALMGTSKDLNYDVYHQGAGRIDVLLANGTPVLANPPSVSLGRLSSSSNQTSFTVTFTNVKGSAISGTLSWKLTWALTNLFVGTSNTTDLSSMLKANVSKVDIAKDGSASVRFTVTYGFDSHVGHHLGEIKLTVGSSSVRIPLAFYVRAPILLVDDDNSGWSTNPPYNNHNPTYAWTYYLDSSKRIGDALVSLGMPFDVFTVRTLYNGPSKSEMDNYRLVIWNCGFDYNFTYGGSEWGRALSSTDQSAIKSYVSGGGRLWQLGSLIQHNIFGAVNKTALPATDFLRSVFGIGGFKRHSGTPDPIKGVASTFMAGVSYDVSTSSFGNMDYGVNLTPTDKAYQVMNGPTTDPWGASWTNVTSAVARDSGTGKTLYCGFEFAQIYQSADRKGFVNKALSWFDVAPAGKITVPTNLTEGSTFSLTASVTNPLPLERYTYQWDLDYDGSSFSTDKTGSRVDHSYRDDGKFDVALRVKEQHWGLVSQLTVSTLDVANAAPEAHISTSSPGNESSPMFFYGNATDPGGNDTFTWEWDFDYDGLTFDVQSTERNATHTYPDDGGYTVALRVKDDEGLYSTINTTEVIVHNLPPTGNIFTPGMSTEGELVPFTATVSDPSPQDTVTVEWDFEYDGSNFNSMANGTAVNYTYRDDGMFDVAMRLTDDDGGVFNVTLRVTVRNANPVVNFNHTAPADEGDVVDFNSTATDPGELDILSYEWDFDYDGVNFTVDSIRINASNQYAQDGNYTVALRVRDDDGGSTLFTKEIIIHNVAPKAIIQPPPSPVEGTDAQFKASQLDPGREDVFIYKWDFGDGQTSTERDPVHAYLDNGTFRVNLTVTDDSGGVGMAGLDLMVANVNPNATVVFNPPHVDENETVYFRAQGRDASPHDEANLTYTWNFGDDQFSNDYEVEHRYLDDGNYTVTLTVQDDDGGVATYRFNVLVDNVAPMVYAQADRDHLPEGGVVNFTAMIDDPGVLDEHVVQWDFGDGQVVEELEVNHRFLDDGNYIIILTVTDDDGGTNTTTFLVAVSNVRPVVTATANETDIDEGSSVSFTSMWTDASPLDTHVVVWDFDDGTNSTKQNVTHTFPQDGTYSVVVTVVDDDGGASSKVFLITVANVDPVPTISYSSREINEGDKVTLSASAEDPGVNDVLTFFWDLGDGTKSEDTSVHHQYLDNGKFRIALTVYDEDGGQKTTTITLIVNNVPPEVSASADRLKTTIGQEVTFQALATDISPLDNVSYSWKFGDGMSSDLQVATHVYTLVNVYEVQLIVSDDDGGQTLWTVKITVEPDLDGDRIPDSEDDDIDGDGVKNEDDDFPRDPSRDKDYRMLYVILLFLVAIVVAIVLYAVTRPRKSP